MEVIEIIRLTTCAIVLLNIIMVTDVDAVPHGGYRRGRTSNMGYNSNCIGEYMCVAAPNGKKSRGARCIPMASFCNGLCDCPLGDDERLCHLFNPTVTITKNETMIMNVTVTENSTITPVVILDSTASMVTNVTCSLSVLASTAFPGGIAIPAGVTICTQLIVARAAVAGEFLFVPTTPSLPVEVVKTLTCGPTTLYP